MPQIQKLLCLIYFLGESLFLISLSGVIRNWLSSIKIRMLESFWNKISPTGCKWFSLNAPRTEPLCLIFLGGESLFLIFPSLGQDRFIELGSAIRGKKWHRWRFLSLLQFLYCDTLDWLAVQSKSHHLLQYSFLPFWWEGASRSCW